MTSRKFTYHNEDLCTRDYLNYAIHGQMHEYLESHFQQTFVLTNAQIDEIQDHSDLLRSQNPVGLKRKFGKFLVEQ